MLAGLDAPLGDRIGKIAKQMVRYLGRAGWTGRDALDRIRKLVSRTPTPGQQLDLNPAHPVIDDQTRLAGDSLGADPEDVAPVQAQSPPTACVTGGCPREV